MGDIRDLIPKSPTQGPQGFQSMWYAVVCPPAPFDSADDLYVVIPDISIDQKWGPCRWEPRALVGGEVAVPSLGDECMVILDNRHNVWVVSWWPYA